MDYWHGAGVQQMIDAAQSSADIDAVNAAWQRTADILKARITERDARIARLEHEVMRLTPSIFTPNALELEDKNKELTKKLDDATRKLNEANKSLARIAGQWDVESWSGLSLMGTLTSMVVPALAECLVHLDRIAQAPDGSSRIQAPLSMLAEAMREYMWTSPGAKCGLFQLAPLKDACEACRDALRVEVKALDATLDG